MGSSTSYIERYFKVKKSDRLTAVIEQVDRICSLSQCLLKADLAVLFYASPETCELIPIACKYGDRRVVDLQTLETYWAKKSRTGERVEKVFVSTRDPGTAAGAGEDLFARANDFRCSYQYPHYVDDKLRSVLVAYWVDQPVTAKADAENVLAGLVELLDGFLTLAHQLGSIDHYSLKLSGLTGIFDTAIGELSLADVISQVVKQARDIASVDGVCVFTENRETGLLESRESAGNLPRPDFLSELTPRINAAFGTGHAIAAGAGGWHDLGSDFQSVCRGVVALAISPDNRHKFALAAWTQARQGFSTDDLELLAIYALFSRTVLGNALLVRRLRKANRTLKKSSTRLANFETLAALADMTSGLAHDLNNMIGGVIGRLQLIKVKSRDPQTLAGLEKIEELAMEGAQTIRRIQEFVTGARYKSLEPMDLRDIVRRALALPDASWKKLAAARQVNVVSRIPEEPAPVDGFEPDLITVIEKLVENAVENAPEKSTVAVTVAPDKHACTLSVSDQGTGVPDQYKDKIFYPFFTTKGIRGAGMSLATVHGVVVRHGGSIKYSHDHEKGTVFTVRLAHPQKAEENSDITKTTRLAAKLNVLVVDDDDQIREILNDMLVMEGHQAMTCADAYAALRALETHEYDLMITDLGMPGMSGLDLAGVAHEKCPAMPIAMITGWGTQLDHSEVRSRGILTILSKPFHLKDVRAILEGLTSA